MHYYERTITSGDMVEVEVYKSIRKRNLKGVGRSVRQSETSEKQKQANEIRAEKKTRREILNNFVAGDMWVTLKYRYNNEEDECLRDVKNYLRRLKYYCQTNGLPEFKYRGRIERGERGKWHAHICIKKIDYDVVTNNWDKGSIFIEPMYIEGRFENLAKYLHKHTKGKSHQIRSRNLVPPKEKVRELGKKKIKEIETGAVPKAPKGYYLHDADYNYNDITGTSAVFVFLPLVPVDVGKVRK